MKISKFPIILYTLCVSNKKRLEINCSMTIDLMTMHMHGSVLIVVTVVVVDPTDALKLPFRCRYTISAEL